MTLSEKDITRGHEFYLRHLLLLGQAAPVSLKAILEREVSKSGKRLGDLLAERKDTFKTYHNAEFYQLFKDEEVNTDIDSWDTLVLCVVILVLFDSYLVNDEVEAIKIIKYQSNELEKFAHSASITYKTFEEKWVPLHSAFLELNTGIHDKMKFECTRMIYSFKSEDIRVHLDLFKQIKKTHDVKLHLKMVIQDKIAPRIHGDIDQACDKDDNEYPVFTETLQDKVVYVGDSAILTCKLNVSENTVTWRHDYKPVKETETLKFLTDKCTHWLAISRAKLSDIGEYACACGKSSTKCSLQVLEKSLKIVKDLHVATIESDIRENMDIVLICEVNLHTNKVVWRHNEDEIRSCNRRLSSVNVFEHRLIIRKAKFEDEGDYTVHFSGVSSSTKIIIKGNVSLLHRKQLMENQYKNWLRSTLGLKYLKIGLEGFTDTTVKAHHDEIISKVPTAGIECTDCTLEVLLPWHNKDLCHKQHVCLCSNKSRKRKVCPNNGFCSKFYDTILWDHQFFDPMMTNTDIQKWSSDPWSVGACNIHTAGYNNRSSAKQIDCAGVLSLFINNCFFERSLDETDLNDKTDLFKKAKDARNDILHNANYELSECQMCGYIDLFKSVLEIKNRNDGSYFFNHPGVKEAINSLNELREHQIDLHISEDRRYIKDLQEHAQSELAEKVKEADKQNHMKVQKLEEQLTHKEKELQLMIAFRSTHMKGTESKDPKVPFQLDFHIRVIGSSGETITEGRQRIYDSMKDFVANYNHDKPTAPIYASDQSTDQSVRRILGYITNIEGCHMKEVLETKISAYIEIHCFTCDAFSQFLKYINGNELQEETQLLRKCLQIKDKITAYDVIASCSSENIENTRKRLHNFTCDIHQGTQCTWYCSDHDKFFCSACKDSDHRSCVGLKQVVSERSYGKQNQRLAVNRKLGDYNIQIKNRWINRDANDECNCDIDSIRMLPDGNVLLIDSYNMKLKKIDSSYNVVSHCDIPKDSYSCKDVCYIGNDRAVVCSEDGRIQYVNVSGKMKLEHAVQLKHECHGLVCHGDTLYVIGSEIYTYTIYCQGKHLLYNIEQTGPYFSRIAISDDAERIYFTNGAKGLITIDNKGNHLFTLKADISHQILDVCVVGDGTVLVLDLKGSVHQVDYSGKQVLGTIAVDRSP
ncbi:uncharacterized protein LOC128552251, partial [Mercenaria mercenaria]|uniref:uncharacterized protein LOC128552251 n=1 Tax=Mercenaria mercenaria TaxID=6596 RepID=UPI00234E8DC4